MSPRVLLAAWIGCLLLLLGGVVEANHLAFQHATPTGQSCP